MGDVLTWSVKSAIKAKNAGCSQVLPIIFVNPNQPSCINQKHYINEDNFEMHFNELLPAFQFHPLATDLKVFRNRDDFLKLIHDICIKNDNPYIYSYYLDYVNIYQQRNSVLKLMNFYNAEITHHKDINSYYTKNGEIPLLHPKNDVLDEVNALKEKNGSDKVYVSLNFRLRALDKSADAAITTRDSNLNAWLNFLKQSEQKYPNICYILLGKLDEKPEELLELGNILVPRLHNQNLGHELAWIESSDFFMGSSSGFAAYANFSQVPYVITKMSHLATNAYDIPFGSTSLPFATKDQELIYDEESPSLLYKLLDKLLTSSNKKACAKVSPKKENLKEIVDNKNFIMTKKELISLQDIRLWIKSGELQRARNSLDITLYRSLKQEDQDLFHYLTAIIQYEFGEYPESKNSICKLKNKNLIDKANQTLDKINSRLLLEGLDRFLARNTDTGDNFLGIEKLRAKCLIVVENYVEAQNALKRHKKINPHDFEIETIQLKIKELFNKKISTL